VSRDNSGTLGKNKRKESETHPEYTGQCLIDGVAYWISAWVKESEHGKFFSLSFRPKEESKPKSPKRQSIDDLDSDIPF
jgi:hypothetical protein